MHRRDFSLSSLPPRFSPLLPFECDTPAPIESRHVHHSRVDSNFSTARGASHGFTPHFDHAISPVSIEAVSAALAFWSTLPQMKASHLGELSFRLPLPQTSQFAHIRTNTEGGNGVATNSILSELSVKHKHKGRSPSLSTVGNNNSSECKSPLISLSQFKRQANGTFSTSISQQSPLKITLTPPRSLSQTPTESDKETRQNIQPSHRFPIRPKALNASFTSAGTLATSSLLGRSVDSIGNTEHKAQLPSVGEYDISNLENVFSLSNGCTEYSSDGELVDFTDMTCEMDSSMSSLDTQLDQIISMLSSSEVLADSTSRVRDQAATFSSPLSLCTKSASSNEALLPKSSTWNSSSNSTLTPSSSVGLSRSRRQRSIEVGVSDLLQLLKNGVTLLAAHIPDLPPATISEPAWSSAFSPSPSDAFNAPGVLAPVFGGRRLPRKTELCIFSFLGHKDLLLAVSMVNHSWNLMVSDVRFLWKEMCLRCFGVGQGRNVLLSSLNHVSWDKVYRECCQVDTEMKKFVTELHQSIILNGSQVNFVSRSVTKGFVLDTSVMRIFIEWEPLCLSEQSSTCDERVFDKDLSVALWTFLKRRDWRSEFWCKDAGNPDESHPAVSSVCTSPVSSSVQNLPNCSTSDVPFVVSHRLIPLPLIQFWEETELLPKDAVRHLLHCLCPDECSYTLSDVQRTIGGESANVLNLSQCESLSARFLNGVGGVKASRFFRNGEWDHLGASYTPIVKLQRGNRDFFTQDADSGVLAIGPRGIAMWWFVWKSVDSDPSEF